MQSRVRLGAGLGLAEPASLGGIAASILSGQHQAGRAAGFGGELQAAPCGQGKGFLGFCDDQGDGGRAQGFLDTPQEIHLALGPDQMQPRANTFRQAIQHRQFRHMGGQDPDQRPKVARRLKQGKGPAATPLGLMHAGPQQVQRIGGAVSRSSIFPNPFGDDLQHPIRQRALQA